MVREKTAKTATLIVSVFILVASFITVDWNVVGIANRCPLTCRFFYPFFHANIIHAIVNVWCLLCIVFLYDISGLRLLISYLLSVFVPDFLLNDIPTIGLSCVCYTLLGSLSFSVRRKLYFQFCMALYITVGFFLPSVNGEIHVYGYIAGLIVGFLTYMRSCFRK